MAASVVNPDTFEDEWFGSLSDREMLIWIGVITRLRDDQGRFVENPALARARLFPYRDVPVADVAGALDRFVVDGRLHRYQAGSQVILQVVNWWRYQRLQWAAPSKLPAPEGWTDRVRVNAGGKYHTANWKATGGFQVDPPGGAPGGTPTLSPQVDPPGGAPGGTPTLSPQVDVQVGPSEPEPEPEPEPKEESPPKPRRVSAISAEEWEYRADQAMAAAWFPSDLRQLGSLMAERNKSGTVAVSRLVRELYEPVVALQKELSREALRHGLRAAITAHGGTGAPNASYVHKAALGYQGRPSLGGNGSRALSVEERTERLTEYDIWALDDPRFRDAYLERFGDRIDLSARKEEA